MTSFRVWAPNAKTAEVEAGGNRYSMTAAEHGWWFAEVSLTESVADYAFVLDGGEPLPDPRSPWQPRGIDGRSRLVDHESLPGATSAGKPVRSWRRSFTSFTSVPLLRKEPSPLSSTSSTI